MRKRARLIVIAGLPGVGKTTLAMKLEQTLSAVRMSADEWMESLGLNLRSDQDRSRVERLQWKLIERLLLLDMRVIVEWGAWTKWERDAFRIGGRNCGAAVELHFLTAPVDELFERVQTRAREEPAVTWEVFQEWASMLEPPTDEELTLFDPPLLEVQ